MGNKDKDMDNDEFLRRMKAHLKSTASRGNMRGVDPDNPFEIQRHEKEAQEFLHERLNLEARILYVHGFASSGNSNTASCIQKYFPKSKVFSPDLPIDPIETLTLLHNIVKREKIDVAIGTSMGGMFCQKLKGVPKVLVNPSFHVSESMRKKIGIVPFYKQRNNGATEFMVTQSLCDAYFQIEKRQFNNLTEKEKSITYGLFGTDDDVVNCQNEDDMHYTNKMIFVGGHRLSEEIIHDYVVEAILKVLKA